MKLRKRITLQFVGVVLTILTIALLSVYIFTDFFLDKNFYRRLNNRAETIVGWLSQIIDSQQNTDFLENLLKNRKDQLPSEEIIIYNLQNKVIFASTSQNPIFIEQNILKQIRLQNRIQFKEKGFDGVGILYKTPTQRYLVIALAQNNYGQDFLKQMRWMMIGIVMFSIIFISITGWFYAKKTLEPIEKIDFELNNISPKNINKRLRNTKNNDEIDKLSQTINQLLERVEEGINLQKMFIGNVSHELQNPLTRISSQLEVSLFKERTPTDYQKTIYSALEDITDLVTMTQNLLKLSRVTADNQALLVENIRLDELLFDTKKFILKNYPNYKIEIIFETLPEDPEHLCIIGNNSLLKTALVNLVQNACKFSLDNHAYVVLSVSPIDKIIYVKDNGVGIASSEIEFIFEPFYRSEKTAQTKGYGIGLSLVDKIIKMHKGTVGVESTLGKGTTFKILF
ncbi:ATP-binding protein [Emticicia sp. SJ17W-69]|uniref:sensor histidine kinase n=1 Tax=Emticicia sp. SJ17W-69 TaxID=3421657 RepID=UPI003EBA4026